MAQVDYLNPDALIGTTSAPPGSPGPDFLLAGRGALTGALQGQAASQSQELLNMAKQQQQMATQKQNIDLGEYQRLQPNRMANAMSETKLKEEQAIAEHIKNRASNFDYADKNTQRNLDQSAFLGQYSDFMGDNQIQNMQVHKQMVDDFHRAYPGHDLGELENYTPNTPLSLKIAKQVGVYADRKASLARGLQSDEYKYKGEMQGKQITSDEKIAEAKNRTSVEIADAANKTELQKQDRANRVHVGTLMYELTDAEGQINTLMKSGRSYGEAYASLSGREQSLIDKRAVIIGMNDPLYKALSNAQAASTGPSALIRDLGTPGSGTDFINSEIEKAGTTGSPGAGATRPQGAGMPGSGASRPNVNPQSTVLGKDITAPNGKVYKATDRKDANGKQIYIDPDTGKDVVPKQ